MFASKWRREIDALHRTGPHPLAQIPMIQLPPEDKIIIGLDVGQVRDPTALNALQMTRRKDENGRTRKHYTSRLLYRWPLHTGPSRHGEKKTTMTSCSLQLWQFGVENKGGD